MSYSRQSRQYAIAYLARRGWSSGVIANPALLVMVLAARFSKPVYLYIAREPSRGTPHAVAESRPFSLRLF